GRISKPIARILSIRTIRAFSAVKNGFSASSHNVYYVKLYICANGLLRIRPCVTPLTPRH
ncbi:hypothetical protein F7O81_11930, partial [Neisseria meningitidis]|nr:hypothetical protein [Neisseria meningitidis]MBG8865674.1 hypothetical protein [Neisseria meningitidis]MBG8867786.1 hypothetical protein [Neisseria meningitidis]MBG8869896.1 hypothetical protein [Neisseria meningitidis]MBG8872013.1 hypothetical protein [Neisseria meningitidis]